MQSSFLFLTPRAISTYAALLAQADSNRGNTSGREHRCARSDPRLDWPTPEFCSPFWLPHARAILFSDDYHIFATPAFCFVNEHSVVEATGLIGPNVNPGRRRLAPWSASSSLSQRMAQQSYGEDRWCTGMSSLRRRFEISVSFIKIVLAMIRVSWQAQPLCFAGLIGVLVVQGLLPLVSALLMKTLFDLLSQSIFRRTISVPAQWVVFLLVAQAALLVTSSLLSPLNQYFNAELGRRISLQLSTRIYQKFSSFVGLSYFEDPQFQNNIRMASMGAQMSPL